MIALNRRQIIISGAFLWLFAVAGTTLVALTEYSTSAATTNLGRIYYGLMIGLLIYVIRVWGGYPDGVAFAVLLANMCVPLIDYYTQPRVYGE